jgi:hypothetical protein
MEPAFAGKEFIDFPNEIAQLFKETGFKQIGKVYLPKRSSESSMKIAQGIAEVKGIKSLSSDCREILTFQKP